MKYSNFKCTNKLNKMSGWTVFNQPATYAISVFDPRRRKEKYFLVFNPNKTKKIRILNFKTLFNPPSSGISSCVRTVYTVMCLHTWCSPAICFIVGSDLGLISRYELRALLFGFLFPVGCTLYLCMVCKEA